MFLCAPATPSQFIFVGWDTSFNVFGNFLLAANPSKLHSKHERTLYSFDEIFSVYVCNTCSHDDNNYNNINNSSNSSTSVNNKNNNYLAVTNSNIVITLSFFISLICYATQLQQQYAIIIQQPQAIELSFECPNEIR